MLICTKFLENYSVTPELAPNKRVPNIIIRPDNFRLGYSRPENVTHIITVSSQQQSRHLLQGIIKERQIIISVLGESNNNVGTYCPQLLIVRTDIARKH